MQKRQTILLAVLGVVVIATVVFYALQGDSLEPPQTGRLVGVNLATGKEVIMEVPTDVKYPVRDPETGEEAVYPWFFDEEAGKRFVPNLERQADGPPRIPVIPVNPHTGNTGVAYVPEWHEESLKGDEPLPEWPVE